MPTRRTFLSVMAAGALPIPLAAADSYAGFRVVRAVPAEPAVPQIELPPGYAFTAGSQYRAASRAEYLAFVQGARDDAGVPVTVRWPKQRIVAVVAGERRLPLTAVPDGVRFQLPVWRATARADSPTVQVWSHLSAPDTGLYWHIEHNDPDRAAGVWQTVAWPATQTRMVIAYMLASRAILLDSGLIARARQRRHFFALMGFETNNTLHADNPPHWHLSYYPGPTMGAARATVPHFWIDAAGKVFYNGQDVQGSGRTQYRVDQPAPILDGAGGPVLTTTIRADGSLDLDPPEGPRYSMVPDAGVVRVRRAGLPWLTVACDDDVRAGLLRTETVHDQGGPIGAKRIAYRYDALTGVLQETTTW